MADEPNKPLKTSKDKGHKTVYFPEIPVKDDLKTIMTTRLGQRDILPTRIVERLLSSGAVVAHALSGASHTGTLSDAQHGARGTINNAHAAADITNTPAGSIAATTVQAALNELDTEKSATTHNHDSSYISIVAAPTAGNFPTLTAGGELANSAYGPASFSAAGHNHDADYISIVSTPTAGNFPTLTAGGELVNSAYGPASFSAAGHTHSYLPLAGGTMDDAANVALGTTTGTKIGTAITQKLGFWNKAPVVQPTALTTQLTTITHTEPGTPDYAIQNLTTTTPYGFVTADEGNSVLKVIANLQTRVAELESKLQSVGLLA